MVIRYYNEVALILKYFFRLEIHVKWNDMGFAFKYLSKKKRVDNSWNKIGKMMEIIEAGGRYMRVH